MMNWDRLRLLGLFGAAGLAACGGGGAGTPGDHVPPPVQPPPPQVRVLGQASFQGNLPNQGGIVAADTLNSPRGNAMLSDDGRIFVADASNGRVIAYRNVPETNNAEAVLVLGKPNLTAPRPGFADRDFFEMPQSVSIGAGKLAIADTAASRVLIYETVPSTDGAPASFVVGQISFTDTTSRGCAPDGLNFPRAAAITPDGKLVIADTFNHRVLIWNSVPQADAERPDVVLGQQDLMHCNENDHDRDPNTSPRPSATTLFQPSAVWSDGTRLVVADTANNRVLIWRQMPLDETENSKPADIVLGQTSFSGRAPNDEDGNGVNDDAPSRTSMQAPLAVHSDGVRLAVADTENHRVLIWNVIPTQSGTAPDQVVGQPDFRHGLPNDVNHDGTTDDTPSERVLNYPQGVYLKDTNLFITDAGNHRVLVVPLAP